MQYRISFECNITNLNQCVTLSPVSCTFLVFFIISSYPVVNIFAVQLFPLNNAHIIFIIFCHVIPIMLLDLQYSLSSMFTVVQKVKK